MFTARYGNIYTVRKLLQLAVGPLWGLRPVDRRAGSLRTAASSIRSGREDSEASRSIFAVEEVRLSRDAHFAAARTMFSTADVFIFTSGATEAWWSRATTMRWYRSAPGVLGAKVAFGRI